MARLRAVRLAGTTPTASRLRAVRLQGTGVVAPVAKRLRAVRLQGSGAVRAAPHLRAVRLLGSGARAVTVNALANSADVEPESTITITATLAGGGSADTWTWRRISGPAIGINGTGPTVTITAPSTLDGATLTIGVTATLDATTSPEQTFTIAVLPQTEWLWTGTGWLPLVELFTAPA